MAFDAARRGLRRYRHLEWLFLSLKGCISAHRCPVFDLRQTGTIPHGPPGRARAVPSRSRDPGPVGPTRLGSHRRVGIDSPVRVRLGRALEPFLDQAHVFGLFLPHLHRRLFHFGIGCMSCQAAEKGICALLVV